MILSQSNRYRHLAWLVLAFLVTWSGLFWISCFYPLDVYAGGSIYIGVVLSVTQTGLVMSFLQLIGMWLVFGPGRYLVRILFSVLSSLIGLGVMWIATHLSNLDDYNNSALFPAVNGLFMNLILLFPFYFLLLQLPSALVRFIFGWQINWGDTPPPKRPLAISDLLTITTLIAAAVASLSWINFDAPDSFYGSSAFAVGLFWVSVLLLFVLPIVYFTMTPWSGTAGIPGWKGTGLAVYVGLVLLGLFIFVAFFIGWWESIYVASLVFTFVFSLWLSLWISRRTGFRLWTRWSRRAFEREHEAENSDAQEKVSPVDPLELGNPA